MVLVASKLPEQAGACGVKRRQGAATAKPPKRGLFLGPREGKGKGQAAVWYDPSQNAKRQSLRPAGAKEKARLAGGL